MPWSVVSEPSESALNLADLKDHLRLTDNDELGLLELYARAATDVVERSTRRFLISRQVRLETRWSETIELPVAPVQSVNSVQYYGTTGLLETLDPSGYQIQLTGALGKIKSAPNKTYPSTQIDKLNPVVITFTAGYGATFESVPKGLQLVVMMLASHYFVNRSPVEVGGGSVAELPLTFRYAMDAYRIPSL